MCYTEAMDETTTDTMTTNEKITAIENSGLEIAFNECHKIYLLADHDEARDAIITGYSIYPANILRDIIGQSCGLVFVSAWGLSDSPWVIDQCTEDIFEAAEAGA